MTPKNLFLTAGGLSCAVVIGMCGWRGWNKSQMSLSPLPLSSEELPDREKSGNTETEPASAAGRPSSMPLPPPVERDDKKPNARDRLKQIAASGRPADWQSFLHSASSLSAKETLLECIGESGRPEASAFLKECLNLELQPLRRAAIRGLAATGHPADSALLRNILLSPSIAIEETTEAALALGGTKAVNAAGILIDAYAKNGPEELQQCILIGLAQRPFQESESFLRQMLADPLENSSRKKDTLESLGQFDSVKDTFFVPFMDSPEVDVRRGAYQGLGKLAESQMGYLLLSHLQKEKEELARADLYEALCSKDGGNRILLNQIASTETDPMIRLIAAKAVASNLQGAPESDPIRNVFGNQWVPMLTESALHGTSEEGMQAVFALMSAPSLPASRSALERIGVEAEAPKVRELAGKALRPNERRK
jgi:HEAT repeat protein